MPPCRHCGKPTNASRNLYCSIKCFRAVWSPPQKPLADRFWRRVTKTDGCWIWTGPTVTGGYGSMSRGRRDEGHIRAHRASWEIHNGPIPEGMAVLHSCDNPPCVRPDHLRLGTLHDNSQDAKERGRMKVPPPRYGFAPPPRFGEAHHEHRLSDEIVREIRGQWDSGSATQGALGRRYGVSQSLVSRIVRRKQWTHI